MIKKIQFNARVFVVMLLLFASVISLGLWYKNKTRVAAQVIIVSGVSSSGKSSLADALQEQLGASSVVVRLDEYFQKIVAERARQLGWTAHSSVGAWDFLRAYVDDDVAQEVFDYEVRTKMLSYQQFYDAIAQACKKYEYVLVDTVVECMRHYNELQQVVDGMGVKWVLLYCPLDVVAHRLETRANMASFVNNGISLATYESFMAMFTPQRSASWNALEMIDSLKIRKQLDGAIEHVVRNAPSHALGYYKKHVNALRERFLQHFGLLESAQPGVNVYPAFRFDVVLNSTLGTPQELASQVIA